MIFKLWKYGAAAVGTAGLLGALVFGRDLTSYVRCSAKSVQTAVKDSVPIEFELQRARDMVGSIIPELQANIRLIAQEEVEVAALKQDIDQTQERLEREKQQIAQLRDRLATQQVSFVVDGRSYSRDHFARQLAQRFGHFKEGQVILVSKQRLLETRERSLEAAMQMLERTRARKSQLEQQIESLVAQHRLLKAASVGTQVQIDGSNLARAEKLIGEITKRLDVAERVLQHESDFLDGSTVDAVSEADLLQEVDQYFTGEGATSGPAAEGEADVSDEA